MKIDDIQIIPISIDRSEVFKIATGASLAAENVLVRVKSGDIVGWGNGTPNSVTGETTESILSALVRMKEHVLDRKIVIEDIWDELSAAFPRDPSALAGLDIALYDLYGRSEGKKVHKLFNGDNNGVLTDRTIGIMSYEESVEHAAEYIEQGFKALKIKIGLDLIQDIKRIQGVRETVGPDIAIWVDANQGYGVEEAITLCDKLVEYDIEFIEQPVKEDDLRGLKKVTDASDIPIMADETIKDHMMAEKICTEELADTVNIKLMKCGGFTGGRKIVDVIDNYGVDAMVGCMGEVIPSIAAGTNLALSSRRIKYADLDSHFMLSDNAFTGLEFKDGKLWLGDTPGLGIEAIMDKIEKYKMDLEVAI